MMNVTNMLSNKGYKVANQFIVKDDTGIYFQSYNSVIAFIPKPKTGGVGCFEYEAHNPIQLDRNTWDYSVTTSKYRNQFLGCNTAEVKRRIASGEYILTDLN